MYCYVDTVRTAVLVSIITKLVELLAPTLCGKLAARSLTESGSQQHAGVPLTTQNSAYMALRKFPKFHQDATAESLCDS